MTQEEALKELDLGKKITHPHLPEGEYLFKLEDQTFTNKYYKIGGPKEEFWKGHSKGSWADNWQVVNEEKVIEEVRVIEAVFEKPLKALKKQTILNFIEVSQLSIIDAWKSFQITKPGFCSQAYFYYVYKKLN